MYCTFKHSFSNATFSGRKTCGAWLSLHQNCLTYFGSRATLNLKVGMLRTTFQKIALCEHGQHGLFSFSFNKKIKDGPGSYYTLKMILKMYWFFSPSTAPLLLLKQSERFFCTNLAKECHCIKDSMLLKLQNIKKNHF